MALLKRKLRYYAASFMKHDFKASVNVFFESLPLIVGVALASGTSIYSGFIAGIIGALIVPLLGKTNLVITGPGAGLITVSAAAVTALGQIEYFFASVVLAGFFQVLLGGSGLGKLAYFIPSVVIKGLMAAIGIILIFNQLPFVFGYDHLHFLEGEYLSILAIRNSIKQISDFEHHFSSGVFLLSLISAALLFLWHKKIFRKIANLPVYSVVVVVSVSVALLFREFIPPLALKPSHYVSIPLDLIHQFELHNVLLSFDSAGVWRSGLVICFIASIQSLATMDAIDNIDTHHRNTPKDNVLVAQGTGNILSGLLGGLPMISLIARSTTNIESGARTSLSSIAYGICLLAMVFLIPYLINHIPYCILAVILIKVGIRLINPSIVYNIYQSGRNRFYPFLVTVIAILFAGIVVGILAGIIFTFYRMIRDTHKDEFVLTIKKEGHIKHYFLQLGPNVNFLNKKGIAESLEKIPDYSIVEILGADGATIDFDIVETFVQFKSKAHDRHIELIIKDVPGLTNVNLVK
jgi:MFS superfamily sulfate permease-like transporter